VFVCVVSLVSIILAPSHAHHFTECVTVGFCSIVFFCPLASLCAATTEALLFNPESQSSKPTTVLESGARSNKLVEEREEEGVEVEEGE